MPVTNVKCKWVAGDQVFTDNDGNVVFCITPTGIQTAGVFAAITTATTPASGSCAVQLVFSDSEGDTMAVPTAGILYLSEVATGLTQDLADTSIVVLTNGALTNLVTKGASLFTTTATGLLGLTITAAADSYWIVVVLPDGKLLISDECVVN